MTISFAGHSLVGQSTAVVVAKTGGRFQLLSNRWRYDSIMISGAVHIQGGMVGIMEVTGAMVLTMEEIGAMEIIITSQDNVQVTMEGRGEALNNHQEGVEVV